MEEGTNGQVKPSLAVTPSGMAEFGAIEAGLWTSFPFFSIGVLQAI